MGPCTLVNLVEREFEVDGDVVDAGVQPADWYDMIDDFIPVASYERVALIARHDAGTDFHANIVAAAIADQDGLGSVDRTRRRYVDGLDLVARQADDAARLRGAYDLAKSYLVAARQRLRTEGRRDPTFGEFAASIALERVVPSFKAAHMLYLMGHRFDGDTVTRSMLEQVAWAYVAGQLETKAEVAALRPTKAITAFKRDLFPKAGPLLSELTSSAHLDLEGHRSVFERVRGRGAITVRSGGWQHGAALLLMLGDMWTAAWETSQFDFLDERQAVERPIGTFTLSEERPLLTATREYLRDA